jgi:hypothetical protein
LRPAPNALERPDDDVLALGEMEQRLASELDAVRWHRVQLDRRLGEAKVAGRMVDLGAVKPGPVGRV